MLSPRLKIVLFIVVIVFLIQWLDDLWSYFGGGGLVAAYVVFLLGAVVALAAFRPHPGRRHSVKDLAFASPFVWFGSLALVALFGNALTAPTSASRTIQVPTEQESLWHALQALPPAPTWRPWARDVRRLPKPIGMQIPPRESEQYPHWAFADPRAGRDRYPETLEYVPTRRLVLQDEFSHGFDDAPNHVFKGAWTVELVPMGSGIKLTIAESGEILSPFIRFFAGCLGHARNIYNYLEAVRDPTGKFRDPAALKLAVRDGRVAMTETLPFYGLDVNAKNGFGHTPLLIAVWDGDTAIAEALLAKGADVNRQDYLGQTPLWYAAEEGQVTMLETLLPHDADANLKGSSGGSPLLRAVREGHDAVIAALLAHGADVNGKDYAGRTALMYAAKEGRVAIIQALLEKGADVNARDREGWTALKFAAQRYRGQEIVDLLRNAGAKD